MATLLLSRDLFMVTEVKVFLEFKAKASFFSLKALFSFLIVWLALRAAWKERKKRRSPKIV